MTKNKIGTIFLVSILALAGIGVSYSGFSDIITIHGSVNTGTVTFDVADYSGTDVWKIHKQGENDVNIDWHGFISDPDRPTKESLELLYPDYTADLIASSWAKQGTEYNVDMVWDKIFPCTDFIADIIVHYTGSIPAKVSVGTFIWDVTGYNFSPYTTVHYYWYTKDNSGWVKGDEVTTTPVQMHNCHYIGIEVSIHLDQLNGLQGVSGAFSFDIHAIQWNDPCDNGILPNPGKLTVIKQTNPAGGSGFVFTVTGPGGYSDTRTLANGQQFTLDDLEAGTYTVTESVPPLWTLTNIVITGDYANEIIDLPGKSITFDLPEAGEATVLFTNTAVQYQEETAWGGLYPVNVGEPGRWWYYYVNEKNPWQPIWAGQYTEIGTCHVDPSGETYGLVTITLNLDDGWTLQDDDEPVKIQGYSYATWDPDNINLNPGSFTTYKGDELEITVTSDGYVYWLIHLDVIYVGTG